MIELLDIVDDEGFPIGQWVDRKEAHAKGIQHRTTHVWLARKNPETGKTEILLQLRSQNKDSYPGCYDISSAGHIPMGVDYVPSALRELQESEVESVRWIGYDECCRLVREKRIPNCIRMEELMMIGRVFGGR